MVAVVCPAKRGGGHQNIIENMFRAIACTCNLSKALLLKSAKKIEVLIHRITHIRIAHTTRTLFSRVLLPFCVTHTNGYVFHQHHTVAAISLNLPPRVCINCNTYSNLRSLITSTTSNTLILIDALYL